MSLEIEVYLVILDKVKTNGIPGGERIAWNMWSFPVIMVSIGKNIFRFVHCENICGKNIWFAIWDINTISTII